MVNYRIVLLIITNIVLLSFSASGQDTLPERYHRYQGVVDTLGQLSNLFPHIMYLDTMGYSTRDSIPMIRVKISDNPRVDEDEPAVFYCAGVHADEVLSTEVVYNFCEDIIRRWSDCDTEVVNYIDELEIYLIPFINPEGRLVVENGDLDWRKNKSDNDTNGVFDSYDGVDNNRNYDIGWDILGSDNSDDPENIMFRGYEPFSESENIAMAEFGAKYKPVIAVDYHSPTYGLSEIVYYPWDWDLNRSPDYSLIRGICYKFVSKIPRIHDSGNYRYLFGYVNKGDFKNFFYGHFGTIPFTVEISDTTIEDSSLVDDIVADHLEGQYYLLKRALGPGITGVIRDSITMELLEAEVMIPNYLNYQIMPRLSRPDFGRYRRLLAPGSYELYFMKEGYDTLMITCEVSSDTVYTEVNALLVPHAPRPPAPDLVYPGNGDVVNDSIVNLCWTQSEYDQWYLLEIDLSPTFENQIFCDSNLSRCEHSVRLPLDRTVYYWRIRPYNENGWGPYSHTSHFSADYLVNIDESAELPDDIFLKQNFPNPFNSRTKIEFYIPDCSPVQITVYDVLGNVIARPLDRYLDSGWHCIIWDATNSNRQPLASGIYFYSLESSGITRKSRMILLK